MVKRLRKFFKKKPDTEYWTSISDVIITNKVRKAHSFRGGIDGTKNIK